MLFCFVDLICDPPAGISNVQNSFIHIQRFRWPKQESKISSNRVLFPSVFCPGSHVAPNWLCISGEAALRHGDGLLK